MRLQGWDYSQEGMYFLTICAKDRKQIFSSIVGCGILDAPYAKLSKYGKTVENSLIHMSKRTNCFRLEKWVIMPNHVQILITVLPGPPFPEGASGMPRPTNAAIPKFVSSLKRFTNKACNCVLWQNGYHDHIVRDESDFLRIWQYIDNNPAVWLEDKYYSE